MAWWINLERNLGGETTGDSSSTEKQHENPKDTNYPAPAAGDGPVEQLHVSAAAVHGFFSFRCTGPDTGGVGTCL